MLCKRQEVAKNLFLDIKSIPDPDLAPIVRPNASRPAIPILRYQLQRHVDAYPRRTPPNGTAPRRDQTRSKLAVFLLSPSRMEAQMTYKLAAGIC